MKRHFSLAFASIMLVSALLFGGARSAAADLPLFDLTLELDGIDDYASTPDAAVLDLGTDGDFTIECFFYVPDQNNATTDTLIWKNGAYGLYILYSTTIQDRFIFRINTAPTNYVFILYNVDLTTGWHHVAGVFDDENTPTNDLLRIYVDGNQVSSGGGFDVSSVPNSSSALYVGGYVIINPYTGWIEEVRLSDSVRYDQSTYTVPASSFSADANTRGLWHFDESWGATDFLDSSGNGHTLTGSNGAHVGNPVGVPIFYKIAPEDGATNLSASPELSWTSISGVTNYEYCFDDNNNGACDDIWRSSGTDTSVTLDNLDDGSTHYWQVLANIGGEIVYADSGEWWSFTIGNFPPDDFNKSGPADGATNVPLQTTVTWGPADGASYYTYCWDKTDDDQCDDENWSVTSSNASVLLLLDGSTTYYWQVFAHNIAGDTAADGGTWWSFTTIMAPPDDFEKSEPLDGATNVSISPTLSWGAANGASEYEYCLYAEGDDPCSEPWVSTGTARTIPLSGLDRNTTYNWQVRAKNLGGTTFADYSEGEWWSFTTIPDPPGAFAKSGPMDGTSDLSTAFTISWGSSVGADEYLYCVDESDDDTCDQPWDSAHGFTSADLTGLEEGVTYYWQVQAKNPGGITDADTGTWWSFTTSEPAPPIFKTYLPLVIR